MSIVITFLRYLGQPQKLLLFVAALVSGCGNAVYSELDRLCKKDPGMEIHHEVLSLNGVLLDGNAAFCDGYCRRLLLRNEVEFVEKEIDLKKEHYTKLKITESGRYRFQLSDGQNCVWLVSPESHYTGKLTDKLQWDQLCIAAKQVTKFEASHKLTLNSERVFTHSTGVVTKEELVVAEMTGQVVVVNKEYRAKYIPLMASKECSEEYTFFFPEAIDDVLD